MTPPATESSPKAALSRRTLLQAAAAAAVSVRIHPAQGQSTVFGTKPQSSFSDLFQPIRECGHGPAAEVLQSAIEAIPTVGHYPQFMPEAFETRLHASVCQQAGPSASADNIAVVATAGSFPLLIAAVQAFCGSGAVFVRPTPAFPYLDTWVQQAGGRVTLVALRDGRDIDLGAMKDNAPQDRGLLYLCNPHSPTGGWQEAAALRGWLTTLPSSLPVIIDEAYIEYADRYPEESLVATVARDERLLITRTFSKFYGLAGLRIGYGVGHPNLIARLRPWLPLAGVNTVAMAAAQSALADPTYLATGRTKARTVRRRLAADLSSVRMRCLPSQAGFVCFDCGSGERAQQLESVMERAAIRVEAQAEAPGHVRVNLPTESDYDRWIPALLEQIRKLGRA